MILFKDRLARAEPPVASATNFADNQKKRRLDLIKAEEEKEQSIHTSVPTTHGSGQTATRDPDASTQP